MLRINTGGRCILGFVIALCTFIFNSPQTLPQNKDQVSVYVIPIRQDIAKPLVYLIRRAVKEAMATGVQYLILDMETNGGYLDDTLEIIEILERFPGKKITYVNKTAYSAGAFIAVATHQIYMAPESVIGAAAPVMIGPGGVGPAEIPSTFEKKITSAILARIRAYAEKYGHNPDVIEAMVNKDKGLTLDGQVLCPKGEILTLTNREAERTYGDPPRPILSLGTVETLEKLIHQLGLQDAQVTYVKPSGMEKIAVWLTSLSWLWLMLGLAGVYLELKTPGFGIPGIVGIIGFFLYFAGGYFAGLTGLEWLLLFILGIVLIVLEILMWPGVTILAVSGGIACLIALIMAFVDTYPTSPLSVSFVAFHRPLISFIIGLVGAIIFILVVRRYLPKTPFYNTLIVQSASGTTTEAKLKQSKEQWISKIGISITPLRPSGKAVFGSEILDVTSQGEYIEKGKRIRIIDFSGNTPVVEEIR